MERIQKSLYWAIIASETSHIFCCVLPTLFSLMSLTAGLGVVTTMPKSLLFAHEMLHEWEVPMILFSGAIVVLGWFIHYIAKRLDCHDTGCVHGSCEPRKVRSGRVLFIATALFVMNVSVYMIFHRGMGADFGVSETHHGKHIEHNYTN